MKKIPTLFKRTFDERHRKHITSDVTPGLEWVLEGRGIATVKCDGGGTDMTKAKRVSAPTYALNERGHGQSRREYTKPQKSLE